MEGGGRSKSRLSRAQMAMFDLKCQRGTVGDGRLLCQWRRGARLGRHGAAVKKRFLSSKAVRIGIVTMCCCSVFFM